MKIREAMTDFREELLSIIFKGYPDHKKMWKAEEIDKALSSVMYNVSLDYIDKADNATQKELNLEIDRLLNENNRHKEALRELSLKLARLESGDENI